MMSDKKPLQKIKDAIEDLADSNKRTFGGVVTNVYMGAKIFVAEIAHPRIIEGVHETVDKTMDMLDLIELHKKERGD